MKNSTAKRKQARARRSAIAELGLNPDLYDGNGNPIPWTDPSSGALMGGDPMAFAMGGGLQVIGTAEDFASGREPVMREMRLDDIEDDCPVCQMNRERIVAGDPPLVLAFTP